MKKKADATTIDRLLKTKKLKSNKGKDKEVESDSDEDNEDLENNYLNHKDKATAPAPESKVDASDDEDVDPGTLVHESLQKSAKKKNSRTPKVKVIPADETSEQREQRTIFVGNVALEVASKKVSSLAEFLHQR